MTEETLPEIKRPFQIFGQLDGIDNFHSGHFTKEAADETCLKSNQEAERLGIKTQYIVKPFVG